MKPKFSIPTIIGVAYICIMTGIASGSVGKYSEMVGPYTWTLPIGMLLILGFAFLLGYAGAREDAL